MNTKKLCSACGKELYIGSILSGHSQCSLCMSAAHNRPARRPEASAPPVPSPAPKVGGDEMAEHLAAMRKIQDERTGSARRKEPLAIAAESPKSNGGGDDMAGHLAAMRKIQDERKADERRAKRLGVRTALTGEGVLR